LQKVADRLGLARLPRRIECFDIAHIQGTDTVASMVTFVDGVPARGLYRKFKLRTVDNNDFASMYEVLTRRFKRTMGDDPAWARPDLLVIDGGKGQLGMAVTALTDLGVPIGGDSGVEVIGLAKERELEAGSAPDRIYRRNIKDSIPLRANSPELYVLARIRDEAHRFANTFHRDRRTKASLRSELDEIPGIGATRRQRLLKHFGSVRAVRTATLDELAKAPGMNRKAAQQVIEYFTAVTAAEDSGIGSAPDEEPADASVDPILEPLYEGDESVDEPAQLATVGEGSVDRPGQPDPERGAAADGGLTDDRAAVPPNDTVDHRES
jgi:excinuclease ABC subunit C